MERDRNPFRERGRIIGPWNIRSCNIKAAALSAAISESMERIPYPKSMPMVSIKTTVGSQPAKNKQDMLTSDIELTMLQAVAVDHHCTKRVTQDAMKGMCNSIDKLLQLQEAKFFPSNFSNQEKGHQGKCSSGTLCLRRSIITPRQNKWKSIKVHRKMRILYEI